MKRFCEDCGVELTEGKKFCGECGASAGPRSESQRQDSSDRQQSPDASTRRRIEPLGWLTGAFALVLLLGIAFMFVVNSETLHDYTYERAETRVGEWSEPLVNPVEAWGPLTEDGTATTEIVGFHFTLEGEGGRTSVLPEENWTIDIRTDPNESYITRREAYVYKVLPWPWGEEQVETLFEIVLYEKDASGDGPQWEMGGMLDGGTD